ncbi:MAG: nucleotidyltransferase substrate binding protein [Deltaproteobacteria bacterium]|nr:nucleotidyltransferase substrate binding protein [Deltaproteobacteria bacterium]
MKKEKTRIKNALIPCREACVDLQKSLTILEEEKKSSLHEVLYDACVKRFEVLFEYTWKLLKVASEYQGSEAPGPRPAIQTGLGFGWIQHPDFWSDALEARNGSVHDYFGMAEPDYLKIMKRFVREVGQLIEKVEKI